MNHWIECRLGHLGTFLGGGTPSTDDPSCWGGENDICWLVPSDISSNQSDFVFCTSQTITKKGLRTSAAKLLPTETVCMSSRATIGDCVIAKVPLATNQGFINIICNDNVDNRFLLYWIRANKNYILTYAAGTTFGEIGKSTFKKLKINLPPKLEQQLIASIFEKVSEAIAITNRTVFAAKRVQYSLIQNLLTGRLKADGSWRTEDDFYVDQKYGRVPKGWAVKKWGELIRLEYGKSLSRNNGNVPVYGTNGQIGYTQDCLYSSEGIIVGRKGEYREVHYSPIPFWVIDTAFFVVPKVDLFLKWAFYSLKRLDINRFDSGSAIPSTNKKDVYHCATLFPLDPNEQKLIAGKITSLDDWILSKERKRESLQRLKKSLMQNLITGRIRLKEVVDA